MARKWSTAPKRRAFPAAVEPNDIGELVSFLNARSKLK
jgi:hypothetical protein